MAALGLAIALLGTGWFQRSDRLTVELGPAGPYRVRSSSGPIEVTAGDRAAVHYAASWFIHGPTATAESGDLDLRCTTRWPCRASSVVELPTIGPGRSSAPTELELYAEDQDLLVSDFSGRLVATTVGDGDVILGPIGGTVTAKTERGAVIGHGLATSDVDVETTSGLVELGFRERPGQVSVRSGSEPVRITLPPGDYAVTVKGGSSIAINIGQAADADSRITIHARGPVRIDPALQP